ncbi:unnamed protein product [Didymodactylos carnosus]|uniref:UBC core domain-containing protein n=1 Tax=Didymodactylos carnosus TaxID=1234261 RepID=A0A814UP67_9BILA|nr:unnamed protein product [Didymodactylos carnosus]CAF1178402.1 unnamed protein product [Didymodactylos carnosus]CAF3788242.1 unnamed protein product [Didymodactylos carnosus]CAF3942595.1 unnamed protein product [Didymodactylos carnosus]
MSIQNSTMLKLENLKLIWLDENFTDTSEEHCRLLLVRGEKLIPYRTKPFTEFQLCYNYISSLDKNTSKMFLVVSSLLEKKKRIKFSKLPQVKPIYLFNSYSETNHHPKLLYNPNTIDLRRDLELSEQMTPQIEPDVSFSHVNPETSVLQQIVKEILVRLPKNVQAKQDLIECCESFYKTNPAQLKMIHNFNDEYDRFTPCNWYTRPNFRLHSILNRTCISENIDLIFKLRYFISDLYSQLKYLYYQQLSKRPLYTSVYRGKRMTMDEFQKLKDNIGGLICTNSFLSTTTCRDIALMYCGSDIEELKSHKKVSVVFKIETDTTSMMTKPYANITQWSFKPDEEEVLFSMGAIFKIMAVEQSNDNIWGIQLALVKEEEKFEQGIINDCLTRITVPEFSRQTRIIKRLSTALKFKCQLPIKSAGPVDPANLLDWEAVIFGPLNTPYENGEFRVSISFREMYPLWQPKCSMKTTVYHPNISASNGSICMRSLSNAGWRPAMTVQEILYGIYDLLQRPNGDDYLEQDIANLLKQNKDEFNRRANEYTVKHAIPSISKTFGKNSLS